MWQCTKCGESSEDTFQVCWNCGTSRDGREDPSFARDEAAGEPGRSHQAIAADAVRAEAQAARPAPGGAGRCPHCGGRELIRAVNLGLTAEAGSTGLKYRTFLIFTGTEPVLADLCKGCGTLARMYVQVADREWVTG